MSSFPLISENAALFRGKRVVLRLDLNVPLEGGLVRDAYRIRESLPTLNFLREAGARIIILSHIGKGKPTDTLAPVVEYLNKEFPVVFLPTLMSPENVRMSSEMQDGDVLMLEIGRASCRERV